MSASLLATSAPSAIVMPEPASRAIVLPAVAVETFATAVMAMASSDSSRTCPPALATSASTVRLASVGSEVSRACTRMSPAARMPSASLPPRMVTAPLVVFRTSSAPLARSSWASFTVAVVPSAFTRSTAMLTASTATASASATKVEPVRLRVLSTEALVSIAFRTEPIAASARTSTRAAFTSTWVSPPSTTSAPRAVTLTPAALSMLPSVTPCPARARTSPLTATIRLPSAIVSEPPNASTTRVPDPDVFTSAPIAMSMLRAAMTVTWPAALITSAFASATMSVPAPIASSSTLPLPCATTAASVSMSVVAVPSRSVIVPAVVRITMLPLEPPATLLVVTTSLCTVSVLALVVAFSATVCTDTALVASTRL